MNIQEIKKQVFPRYIGSCITDKNYEDGTLLTLSYLGNYSKDDYLFLKPLEQITDEDAIEVNNLHKTLESLRAEKKVTYVKLNLIFLIDFVKVYQYLQLKGYALPQLVILEGKPVTLSVSQLVEMNIIKLK